MPGVKSDPTHPVQNSGKREVWRLYPAGEIHKFIVQSEYFRLKCKKVRRLGLTGFSNDEQFTEAPTHLLE